jgi:hypothetical protein
MRRETLENTTSTTVSGSVTSGATSLTVVDGSGFPPTGDFRLRVDSEIMLCTARSGNVLTVIRGIEGTIAATHSGSAVYLVLSQGSLQAYLRDNLPYHDTRQPAMRLLDANGNTLGPSDFTLIDPWGTAAVRQVGSGLTVFKLGNGQHLDCSWLTRPLPTNRPYSITACVGGFGYDATRGTYPSLGIRDSIADLALTISLRPQGAALDLLKWTGTSTTSCAVTGDFAYTGWQTISSLPKLWMRITDDGTNLYFAVSENGIYWSTIGTEPRTYNGMTPNQLVFGAVTQEDQDTSLSVFAWNEGSYMAEAGLLNWYPLADLPLQSVLFDYGLGNNLRVAKTVTASTNSPLAWLPQTALFDGVSGYAYGGCGQLPQGTSARSVALRFKKASTNFPSGSVELLGWGNDQTGKRFGLSATATAIGMEVRGGSAYGTWTADTNWHDLVVVIPATYATNNDVKLYLDSVPLALSSVDNTATMNTQSDSGQLTLGCMPNIQGNWFDGNLADVRLYNYALTQAQVTNLYNGLNADGTSVAITPSL